MTESLQIPVSEMFYSIQGEGPYAGEPAIFLRLAGCNLMCGGWHNVDIEEQDDMHPSEDASWVCDTIATWRDPENRYTPKELLREWESRSFLHAIEENDAHIILTGGEPTMKKRQEQIVGFFEVLEDRVDGSPFVEVETNGTIYPTSNFKQHVNHFNVSLKLSNSGMDERMRLNDKVIEHYANMSIGKMGSVFKFVVGHRDDIEEIEQLIEEYDIPDDKVMLMPAGAAQEDIAMTYPEVAELCKEKGWSFSPRLHINIWNQKVGV